MNAIDWNTYAQAYDLLRSIKPYRAMHDIIAAAIKHSHDRHGGYILDAGCGTGNLLTTLSEHGIPHAYMTGIDASEAMCSIATYKHGIYGAHIRNANLDTKLPFKTGAFSVIACVNALYAVKNPAETLREFARVLRPDGLLVIATPHEKANLGLVLKAHCNSTKLDAYWEQFTNGAHYAKMLMEEAFANDGFDPALLAVLFNTNTAIHASRAMHFLSAQELYALCKSAGLAICHSETTYAAQAQLIHATHLCAH